MGVDESMKGKILAEFDRIPGAYPITVELTAEEYSSFEVNAKAAGKSASKFAKERLLKPNVQ